jgi:hypothetical protein
LGTKTLGEANVRPKPVLAGFDRVLRDAATLTNEPTKPQLRASLNDTEITRMAEHVYARALTWDERVRVGVTERVSRLPQPPQHNQFGWPTPRHVDDGILPKPATNRRGFRA